MASVFHQSIILPGNPMRLRYLPELDGLRAVACIAVVCFHATPHGIFRGGFLGVDMFFVLSGYLITHILLTERDRTDKISIGRFYRRRLFRLAPALLLFLAVYVTVAPIVWPGQPHLPDAGLAAGYVTNFTYPSIGSPAFLRHTWPLSIEEQFYLIWPISLIVLVRVRLNVVILTLIWTAISFCRILQIENGWLSYYYSLHTHSSGLIVGATLAFLKRDGSLNISERSGTIALFAFVVLTLSANIEESALTITAAELLAAIIVGSIVCGTGPAASRLLSSKPMIGIGRLSYGLYLWHFPIAVYCRDHYAPIASTVITLGLSFAGAILSYFTVEAWARTMKAHNQHPPGSFKAA